MNSEKKVGNKTKQWTNWQNRTTYDGIYISLLSKITKTKQCWTKSSSSLLSIENLKSGLTLMLNNQSVERHKLTNWFIWKHRLFTLFFLVCVPTPNNNNPKHMLFPRTSFIFSSTLLIVFFLLDFFNLLNHKCKKIIINWHLIISFSLYFWNLYNYSNNFPLVRDLRI